MWARCAEYISSVIQLYRSNLTTLQLVTMSKTSTCNKDLVYVYL